VTRAAFVLLGAACALVPSLAMWGFTVDDALIPVRYAHNLASGAGYRFDARGPSTDGVTPLPWSFVVAALASSDALVTLLRAKVLGIAAWTVAGGLLGARVSTVNYDGKRVYITRRAGALLVMALAFPIGAWAASGMETGLATALATVAMTRLQAGKPRQAAMLAGLVAAFRPEMVVWASVVAVGARAREGRGDRGRWMRDAGIDAALGVLPFVVCAAIRVVAFGRAAPLAVLAKPSDLAHGLTYAAAAFVVVLTPLIASPIALLRGPELRVGRVIVLAFLAHVLVVVAVGGDWMPYARLMVPVAPSLVLVFAEVSTSERGRKSFNVPRLALAAALGLVLIVRAAPAGRAVYGDRVDLVARARPVLAGAEAVATLDVGWVSASTDARIVDLAGLTDPSIAMLPGGHTSKRVDVAMLLDRNVDTVIVYSEMRVVEQRIVRTELFTERFEVVAKLPVGTRGAFYVVYRRRKA
jgi:hypothetical protein